jgi:hypothetical protein
MIKSSAVVLGAVMVVVSTGTYYGLELLPPGLIPPPIGRVHAAEEAPAAAPAPVAIAAAPAAPVDPAADGASAEVTEQDLAEEPAPEAVAAAPAPSVPPPSTPPLEAAPAPAASEPAAAEPAAAEPPAEPAAAPAETAKAESAMPAPAPARAAVDADVIKPWWPDPAKLPANQLKLQYAGQVQGQQAIALLFTSALKLETLQQNATVKTASGETVSGEWSLGKNPKLAVLNGVAPGRYTVILQPQVADQKGFMLGSTLTGPVYVKEP